MVKKVITKNSPGLTKNDKKSENRLSRGVLGTAKLTGRTVGYSAQALSKTGGLLMDIGIKAVKVAVVPAEVIGYFFTPVGKKGEVRRRISRLQTEVNQLQHKMGAKLAANVTAGLADPAADEEVEEWLKAIEAKKKEIDDLKNQRKLVEERKPLEINPELVGPVAEEEKAEETVIANSPKAGKPEVIKKKRRSKVVSG
jgi:hypothetical protein